MRSRKLLLSFVVTLSLPGALRPQSTVRHATGARAPSISRDTINWSALRQLPRPIHIPARSGRIRLYLRAPNGAVVLAANVVMDESRSPRDGPGGTSSSPRRMFAPVLVDSVRRAALSANRLVPSHSRKPAELWGLSRTTLVHPDSRLQVCGKKFDDSVTVRLSSDEDGLSYVATWRRATVRRGDHVGCTDVASIAIAASAPPGRYLVTVHNKDAYWSNPAPLTIRPAHSTTEYLVAYLQALEIPNDLDDISLFESGTEEGEFRFDFATGSGSPSAAPVLQQISFGAHPQNGLEVSNQLRLDRSELQLPLFVERRARMGDQLLFTFFGREFDGDDNAWAGWSILGGLAGAAAGAYADSVDGAVAGYKLGSEIGQKIGDALTQGGETSLGSHTNAYSKGDDYGQNTISYPNVLSFDNNLSTVGRDISIMYRVRSIDALRVHRVRVTLDSVDTRKATAPAKEFYVFARAFDAVVGAQFPENRRFTLGPTDRTRVAAPDPADRLLLDHNGDRDLPFVYIEVTLWAKGLGGLFKDHMIGRPVSKLMWPANLLGPSDESLTLRKAERVASSAGHGSNGEFTIYYTITVDR